MCVCERERERERERGRKREREEEKERYESFNTTIPDSFIADWYVCGIARLLQYTKCE